MIVRGKKNCLRKLFQDAEFFRELRDQKIKKVIGVRFFDLNNFI